MSRKRKFEQPKLGGHKLLIGLLVMVVLSYIGIFYLRFHSQPVSPKDATSGPVPTYFQSAADAMPFPMTVDPAKFQRIDVREAYQVAKEIPEVLAQQPCYCRPDPGLRVHCDRYGHHGLLDCFKTAHATTCGTCIREALLVGQMHCHGKSIQEIRDAIIHGDWVKMGSAGSR